MKSTLLILLRHPSTLRILVYTGIAVCAHLLEKIQEGKYFSDWTFFQWFVIGISCVGESLIVLKAYLDPTHHTVGTAAAGKPTDETPTPSPVATPPAQSGS